MEKSLLLIADDDPEIVDLLAIHLEKEGFHVIKAKDGQETIEIVKNHPVDLLILDIMMPKMDGHEVTQKIRETYTMPIIFLSAKISDFDKVHGLVIGADDYITKPFTPIELVARVKAQLRRSKKFNQPFKEKRNDPLEYGGLVISKDQRKVSLYDKEILLTPKEFDILYLLASHPNKVFTMENIYTQIWGEAYFDGSNTVMVHIRTLRKKLQEDKQKSKWIKTVWGVGYAFDS